MSDQETRPLEDCFEADTKDGMEVMTPRQKKAILKAFREARQMRQRFADLGREVGSGMKESQIAGMEQAVRLLFGVRAWLDILDEVDAEFDAKTVLNDLNEREIDMGG